jgi:hypothetical protein
VSVEEWGTGAAYCQLLNALEAARNRLAVAAAAESKRTPPDRWNEYIRTERRLLRCLRRLRKDNRVGAGAVQRWLLALESLRAPAPGDSPAQSEAERASSILQRALAHLE